MRVSSRDAGRRSLINGLKKTIHGCEEEARAGLLARVNVLSQLYKGDSDTPLK